MADRDLHHDQDGPLDEHVSHELHARPSVESNARIASSDGAEHSLEDNDIEQSPRSTPSLSHRHLSDSASYTHHEEIGVLRKLDRKLVLFLALLYLLSFLDRSNIGNAEVAGLKHDLHLSDQQYGSLLQGFYVTYILFEWMTLLYRVVKPHVYVSLCVAAWGFIASLQAVTTSFAALLFCRLLLGISEAAFSPGVPFYLSFFYRREELAYRVGLFISAAPLASSFASSLAFAITKLDHRMPIQGWRLLFLIEGFPSVIAAVAAWYWIPDSPETARWLTQREGQIAAARLDGSDHATAISEHFQWKTPGKCLDFSLVLRTLQEPKAYLSAAMFFSCNVAFSSMPVFAPILIQAMGYPAAIAQALSALPHLFAFGAVLGASALSDRLRNRSSIIIGVAFCACLGYVILAFASLLRLSNVLRYICLFPITAGFFSAVTLTIVWTMDNQVSAEGKGTGVAVLNIFGQLGPLLGTRLYPDSAAPYYVSGHAACAFFMALVAVLAFVLRRRLVKANRDAAEQGAYRLVRQRTKGEMTPQVYIL